MLGLHGTLPAYSIGAHLKRRAVLVVARVMISWLHTGTLRRFGNIVEIILSTSALLNGLYGVVAASLLGSILSNLLLVTGGGRCWVGWGWLGRATGVGRAGQGR